MNQERASKKQRELLLFIDGFIKGNGYGPSYREIMRALGYKSVSTVAVHVDGLIYRGYLQKRDHSARSLEVVSSERHEADRTHSKTVPTITAEQEIRTKLNELQAASAETHIHEARILKEALQILGYDEKPTSQ